MSTVAALFRRILCGHAAMILALWAGSFLPLSAQETASENVLVVIRAGTGFKVLRASKIENKGDVSNVHEENGKKTLWQSSLIAKTLPLFQSAKTAEYTEEQAKSAISELQDLQQAFPVAKELAGEEMDLWKAFLDERQRAAEERRQKLDADLQAFLAGAFDEQFDYSQDALQAKIEQGEALIQASPEKKAELEVFLSPWRQRLSYLEEKRIKVDGAWITREELAAREESARLAEEDRIFAEVAELNMPALVVPQASVLLVLGFVILALVSILYLFLHLASSRGGNLSFGGALMLLAGLALLGLYCYGGYLLFSAPSTVSEIPALFPAKEDPEAEKPLRRVLYLSARPSNPKMSPGDLKPAVKDQALNAYLRQNLKFTSTEPDQFFDMRRTGIAMRSEPHQVTLYEETVCLGKAMLITYEVACSQTSDKIEFNTVDVKLGGAPLPGSLSSYLWKRFSSAYETLLTAKSISQTYQLNEVGQGILILAYAPRMTDREMTQPLPATPDETPGSSGAAPADTPPSEPSEPAAENTPPSSAPSEPSSAPETAPEAETPMN